MSFKMNLLTLSELESKALPKSTLTRLCREGKLKGAFKIGKKWLVSQEDFNAFINKEREAHMSPLSTNSDQLSSKKVGQDEL